MFQYAKVDDYFVVPHVWGPVGASVDRVEVCPVLAALL